VEVANLVKIEYVEPVGFVSSGLWSFYSSGSSLQNTEQQSISKTAGVVCFGDKTFALCVRLMLDFQTKEVISSHKGPGQT
jgi:hypothetical protein